ncbi:hypothetical protein SY88_22730 [Clostridiales bacterium PH28_bin88]|nr:hypothetical protein SY88_22730 [Clostridiales bacterium PH28_bin88]
MKPYLIAGLLAVSLLGITACSDTTSQKPANAGLTVKEIEETLKPQNGTQGKIEATTGVGAKERDELNLQKVQELEIQRRQEEIARQLEQDRILEQWRLRQQMLKEQQGREIQRQVDQQRNSWENQVQRDVQQYRPTSPTLPPTPSYTPPPPKPAPTIPFSPGGRF